MNIAEIVRKNLQQSELYLETQQVLVNTYGENIEINWYPRGQQSVYSEEWPTHFELLVSGQTCKIERIAIDRPLRGKGHGKTLYQIIEAIAKDIGCTKITATPIGLSRIGETRKEYMMRLGYQPTGPVDVEKILA